MADVHLSGPHVTPDGDRMRTVAELRVGEDRQQLWFASTAPAISTLLDPFVAAVLPVAMKHDRPVHLHGPVSAGFVAALPSIQRVFELYRLDRYDADRRRFWPVDIVTDDAELVEHPAVGTGVATMFSCGVDSFYTAITRRAELDTLLFIDDFDAPMPTQREEVHANAATAAAELGLTLRRTSTNAKPLLAGGLGAAGRPISWRMLGGSVLESVALLHAPVAGRVLHPSSDTPGSYATFGTTPWLDPLYSAGGQVIEHDDYFVSRFEKVQRIADEPAAQAHLRVCWRAGMNCGTCPKCVRTMLALEAVGVRELFTTFSPCSTEELCARVRAVGPADEYSRTEYFDQVDAFLDRSGTRPDLRAAIAASGTPEPTISRLEALQALTPESMRQVFRRVRRRTPSPTTDGA